MTGEPGTGNYPELLPGLAAARLERERENDGKQVSS